MITRIFYSQGNSSTGGGASASKAADKTTLNFEQRTRMSMQRLNGKTYESEEANLAHIAVIKNDLPLLQTIIQKAPELLTQTDKKGCTPVLIAAMLNRPQAFEMLAKANPKSLTIAGSSGLHAVSLAAHWSEYGTDTVDLIARLFPETLLLQDKENNTAIDQIISENPGYLPSLVKKIESTEHKKKILLAVRMKTSVTRLNKDTYNLEEANLAHLAVIKNDLPLLQTIIQEAPELLTQTDKRGGTPVLIAAMLNRPQAFEMLAKANPKSLTIAGSSGLHAVSLAANWSEYGTDTVDLIARLFPETLLLQDKENNTAIDQIIMKNPDYLPSLVKKIESTEHKKKILLAVRMKTSVTRLNKDTYNLEEANLAHLAVIKNDLPLLQTIIQEAPELLTQTDKRGGSPVLIAAMLNRPQAFEMLAKANPKSLTIARSSGLHAVSLAAHWSEYGTDTVDLIARLFPETLLLQDKENNTAIDQIISENPDYLPSLVKKIENTEHKKKILLAVRMKTSVTRLNKDTYNLEEANLAHLAVIKNDLPLLQTIIQEAPELLTQTDKSEDTPVLIAAMLNRHQAFEMLAKANPNSLTIACSDGSHAVSLAANWSKYGGTDTVDVIARLFPETLLLQDKKNNTAIDQIIRKNPDYLPSLVKNLDENHRPTILKYIKEKDLHVWQKVMTELGSPGFQDLKVLGDKRLAQYLEVFELEEILGFIEILARYKKPQDAIRINLMRKLRELVYGSAGAEQKKHLTILTEELNFGEPPVPNPRSDEAAKIISDTEGIWQQGRWHCKEFPSFIYDTIAYRKGLKPLIVRIAEAINKDGIEFLPASSSEQFPGRGFCINGLALEKVFPNDQDYTQSMKRWANLTQGEELSELLTELENTKFFFTRGAQIIMPPDNVRYYLPGKDLSQLEHYSYVFINSNFPNGEIDDFFLAPTSILNEILPRQLTYSQKTQEGDMNKVPLSIEELKKLLKDRGATILEIGSFACFNMGLQNAFPAKTGAFFAFEEDLSSHAELSAGHLKLPIQGLTNVAAKAINSQLQQAHQWVAKVSRRLQCLKNLFNLIYSSAHKGFCGPPVDLGDTSLTMLIEAKELYEWFRSGGDKQKQLIDRYGYPLLCIADAWNYSAGPNLSLGYLDIEDFCIKNAKGEILQKLDTNLTNHDTINAFREFFEPAREDSYDLRFLPAKLLREHGG